MNQDDLTLASYNYEVPITQIAQYPNDMRENSKLLIMDRKGLTKPVHRYFKDIVNFIPDNALLVVNNTSVTKCRFEGKRENGGKSELLLLTPLPLIKQDASGKSKVNVLIRPASKSPVNSCIYISNELEFIIEKKLDYGQCIGELRWRGNLEKLLEEYGKIPLPPYINRLPDDTDEKQYQTIYAKKPGSAAAPTAGLHFSSDLKKRILAKGIGYTEITLHVGYGTFSPVRSSNIQNHKMHEEYVEILPESASIIAEAKAANRPVIAVGTTTLRALEGSYNVLGKVGPFSNMVNIFIYPGKEFKVVDELITNFHLPQSTLLMLVSAFAGRENIINTYKDAIQRGYRLFSYGDAMYIKN